MNTPSFATRSALRSNLNPRMAQRFFNLVLLDAVRADILENKKVRSYEALRILTRYRRQLTEKSSSFATRFDSPRSSLSTRCC